MNASPNYKQDESKAEPRRDTLTPSWPKPMFQHGALAKPLAIRGCAEYVLHCFDDIGRRLPAKTIEAEDDAVAIAIVRLHLHNRCEL